jgi:hypothetical protein
MRNSYRISVTTLEKFRRFTADTSSFDTEEALLETIAGTFTGNDKTRVGSAFHKIIEVPGSTYGIVKEDKKGNSNNYRVSEGIAFPLHVAAQATQYRCAHPLSIYEVPVRKVYELKKYSILISGRMDSLEGVQIRDAKTKFRAPTDLSDYTDSLQWMLYLDMLGLKVFHFDIFEVKRFKELVEEESGICYLEGIDMVAHDPITCYAYNAMHEYIMYMLERFMEYIEFRNLFHLLKPAHAPVPAEV